MATRSNASTVSGLVVPRVAPSSSMAVASSSEIRPICRRLPLCGRGMAATLAGIEYGGEGTRRDQQRWRCDEVLGEARGPDVTDDWIVALE